jgi:phage baseplate assembly protein W
MGLSPLKPPSERINIITPKPATSKTYSFDFDTGEFTGGMLDGADAIRQYVRKAIATPRYRHLIYSRSYGCELESLVGQDISQDLLETEIPRIISESLEYDDRIADVNDFVIDRQSDQLYVEFTVTTKDGVIVTEGVTI